MLTAGVLSADGESVAAGLGARPGPMIAIASGDALGMVMFSYACALPRTRTNGLGVGRASVTSQNGWAMLPSLVVLAASQIALARPRLSTSSTCVTLAQAPVPRHTPVVASPSGQLPKLGQSVCFWHARQV